ncbi:MAG: hypothetical protein EHM72_16860, partial [Calditrichaeota bacterium]
MIHKQLAAMQNAIILFKLFTFDLWYMTATSYFKIKEFRRRNFIMKPYPSHLVLYIATLSLLMPLRAHGTDTKQVIAVDAQPTRWTLSTENSTCQIILTEDQNLTPGYYGPTAGTRPYEAPDWTATIENGTLLREIPYRGGFIDMAPALEVIFADLARELELIYQGYEILEEHGHPVLRLDMKDRHYPLAVSEFIRVLPELDLLEKWLVLKNIGAEDILIEKAYSGSFLLPQGAYDFIQFSGDWGRESIPRRSRLTPGSKTIAVRDVRSHQHAGVFMIRPQDEIDEFCGAVWFGGPVWAGNWLITAEVNRMERTQIVAGINEWDTSWTLRPGVSFTTPKMIMGCTIGGTAAASIALHHYTLDHLLPQPFNTQPSQVLYNSWYATTFHVNEKDQIKLAEIARDIGVELFVIDDGWFKGRNDDHAGLGDWIPDPQKFPRGLSPMIQKINELGMDFGIWVEP